jgi:hypothetical protein
MSVVLNGRCRDGHKHECNFWTKRVISTRIVRFSHAECGFYRHTSEILTSMSVSMTLTITITTRSSVILHAECDFQTQSAITTRTSVIYSRTS